MKRRYISVILSALIIFIFFCTSTSIAWATAGAYVWNKNIVVKNDSSVTQAYNEACATAALLWNSCLSVYTKTSYRMKYGSSNNVEVLQHNYGNNGWAGLTTKTISSKKIITAKVAFNTYKSQTKSQKQTVAVHEFGHVLGLEHTVTSKFGYSIMKSGDYTITVPQVKDGNDLASMYGKK